MANYRQVARRAAQRYGLDPGVFERQIQQESRFNPGARSSAGAGRDRADHARHREGLGC
jgi:soluble lytic murein transglycosylase-like protein